MIGRIITLEELMKRFSPDVHTRLSHFVGVLRQAMPVIPAAVQQEVRHVTEALDKILEDCTRLELPVSLAAMNRLGESPLLNFQGTLTTQETAHAANAFQHLLQTLEDEMRSRVFLLLEPDRVPLAFEPHQFGEKVDTEFPDAAWDIEEAARCLAFDHWTAAVFHLGRVAELALVAIANRVGYGSPKPGFGDVLKFLDNNLKVAREEYGRANPRFKGHVEFCLASLCRCTLLSRRGGSGFRILTVNILRKRHNEYGMPPKG